MSHTLRSTLVNYFKSVQTSDFIPKDLIIQELKKRGCRSSAESIGRELRDMRTEGLLKVDHRLQADGATRHAWYRSIMQPKLAQKIIYTETGVQVVYVPTV